MGTSKFGMPIELKMMLLRSHEKRIRGGEKEKEKINMIFLFTCPKTLKVSIQTTGYFSTWVVLISVECLLCSSLLFLHLWAVTRISFNFIIEFFITFGSPSPLGNFLLYGAANSLNSISCSTNYEDPALAGEKVKRHADSDSGKLRGSLYIFLFRILTREWKRTSNLQDDQKVTTAETQFPFHC